MTSNLDTTFAALADPTRRAMLVRLADQKTLSAGALAEPFSMSLPAVLKHIGVLADAGLVKREKIGRTVQCQLDAAPLQAAQHWIAHYEKFWTERLDALAALLEEDTAWPKAKSPSSPSSATSRRPSKKSSRRGPALKR